MAAQRLIKRMIMLILFVSTSGVLFYSWNTPAGPVRIHQKAGLSFPLPNEVEQLKHANQAPRQNKDKSSFQLRQPNAKQPIAAAGKGSSEREQQHSTSQDNAAMTEEMVGNRFKERLDRMHKACRLYSNTSLFRRKRAGYVPMPMYRPVMNISVRYCPIAKTSATTWTSFFAAIRGHMRRKKINGSEDRSNADDVIHFTFVREPYARMLSGYVDKLLTPNALFWWITGRYVVRKFRPNATMKSLKCGHDVTFPEFVKYVVHSQRTGENLNGHFMPTHDQCDFCTLPYRFIGHLETMREDMPYITKAIHSPINYTRTYDSDTILQNAKMVLWDERVGKVLKCMDRDEAARRLWRKYQIRGLISKDELFPFPRGGAVNITLQQFNKIALRAYERSKKNPWLKEQRKEALREAFADVPMQDRLDAQQTLFLDFQMFGFDPLLEDVFPQTPYVKDKQFSYFKIYD